MFLKWKFPFKVVSHKIASRWLQPIVLAFLAALSLLLMRPHVVGSWGDDTTYLIAAKSLAGGHGYHLISWPAAPILTKYPPLFPALLSFIWRLVPRFPDLILFCKLLNIALTLLALNMLYLLARRAFSLPRSLAAMLCLFVGSNATWLSVTLEVMSEPLYLVLTLSALYFAMKHKAGWHGAPQSLQAAGTGVQDISPWKKHLFCLVVLSVLAFYTRTIAISLMGALGVWMLQEKQGKHWWVLYWGGCVVLCLGWILWSMQGHVPVSRIGNFYVYAYNQSYFQEWWLNSVGRQGILSLVGVTVQALPNALFHLILPFNLPETSPATTSTASLFIHGVLLSGFVAGVVWLAKRSENAKLLGYYVFFYLLLLFVWSSPEQASRLLVCIFPIIALLVFQLLQRRKATILAIALTMLSLACNLVSFKPISLAPSNQETLSRTMSPELWEDYQATFKAIREKSPSNAIVWARPDGLLFLHTGRRTVNFQITPASSYFRAEPAENIRQLLAITGGQLQKSRARYILLEPYFMAQQPVDALIVDWIRLHRDRFKKVYTSPHHQLFVYRVL